METKAVIIGNPNSGSAGDEGYLERFAETLRDGGLGVEVLNTERPDHATELAAAAGDRLVVAAGGDGTVNEVLNGLSEGATLGILPLGTANVLARELGLPMKPEDACERILTGTTLRMDVGVATDGEGAERRFACMAGIGFDADVVREVTPRLKRYLRSLAFPLVALKVYLRGDRPDVQIVDGDTTRVAQFAVVANGQYYGGEFETAEDASLTSGALEVVLIEKVGLLMRPDVLARILAKSPLDRAMRSFTAQKILAKSPAARGARVPVQIDGEVWGQTSSLTLARMAVGRPAGEWSRPVARTRGLAAGRRSWHPAPPTKERRGGSMGRRRRGRVEPTAEWEQIELLCGWPEQLAYEEIRPLVLFGGPVSERAEEVGVPQRTLYRRVSRFESEGMESLFATERAKRLNLPPSVRRLVVDLKAEYPGLGANEIANICYVRFGRRLDYRTVGRVLAEEPMPLRMVRRFPPYAEIAAPRERRLAVVALHAEGWSAKAIAGYLKVGKSTVYRALRRWVKEGVGGLDDRPPGRPKGVRKVGIREIEAVRRLQRNPGLGAFRVHAALEQMGIDLSSATCGRILALNCRLYGLEAPRGPSREKREMPFASSRRHEYWTADVRYIDEHKLGGRAYVVSVLENHSRAILASAVSRTQDLAAFLSVLYRAVEEHGSPEALVTDGGAIFRATRALAVYEALGMRKEQIERGRPWQSYVETHFNVQRRMADWHFARAEGWQELVAAHDAWASDYNAQSHWAHRDRPDGRRSPKEVLGWVSGVRYRPEDLDRAFFSVRFSRVLDRLGYATLRRWRLYGEEGLAGREAVLWLQERTLTLEHGGEPLSRYRVEVADGTGKLRSVGRPRLFETSFATPQPKLFPLASLGEAGWLKAVRLEDYAPRAYRRPYALQQALFPYHEAWA